MKPLPLESLAELEAVNPRTLREFCYNDGAPTTWERKALTQKDVRAGTIPYMCRGCDDIARYVLKYPKKQEEKK